MPMVYGQPTPPSRGMVNQFNLPPKLPAGLGEYPVDPEVLLQGSLGLDPIHQRDSHRDGAKGGDVPQSHRPFTCDDSPDH